MIIKGFQTILSGCIFYTLLAGTTYIFCEQAKAEIKAVKNGEAKSELSPEIEFLQTTTQSASESASRHQRELDTLRTEFANYQHRIKQATRESARISHELIAARRELEYLQLATQKNREELSGVRQQIVAQTSHSIEPQRPSRELVETHVQLGSRQSTAPHYSSAKISTLDTSIPVSRTLKTNTQKNQSSEEAQKGIAQKAAAGGVKIVKDEAVGSSKRVVKKVVRDAFSKALGL